MQTQIGQFDAFLSRISRRWTLFRMLECIGMGLLVACAVGLVLALIRISRGESAQGLTAIILCCGAVIGGAIGWLSRPNRFDAAVEADRQLDLADLLATALSLRESRTMIADGFDERWAATVLSMADARCAEVFDQPLMLRRFGVRAWGGIGLFATLALTIGALSTNPLVLYGRAVQRGPELARSLDPQTSAQTADPSWSAPAPPAQTDPLSPSHSQMDSTDHATPDASSTDTEASAAHSAAATDRAGSGAGRTNERPAHSRDLDGTLPARGAASGQQATGGGLAANTAPFGRAIAQTLAESQPVFPVPAWQSDDWPAAQQQAHEQIQARAIPDAYRDLVRAYFAR